MASRSADYDVAIIGGGPAGSAAATFLSREGLKCVVLEREKFPRPHVGESLVPATTPVLKELGVLEKVKQGGFVKKYGAAWTSAQSSSDLDVAHEGWSPEYRAEVTTQEQLKPGADLTYTFHVDRARFDDLLLRHAEETGAEVREEVNVTKVDFSKQPWVEVQCRNGQGEERLRARMVVDASGRRTCIGNQLRLKSTDTNFDQYAIHTWFEGFDRGNDTRSDFVFIHFLPLTNSWVWQIPISETITSFGVVTQKGNLPRGREEREDFFWEALKTRPEIYRELEKAKMLRPLQIEGDYSYSMKQIKGDRFVMIGDAARFVDPIFSSGVSIALSSAKFAAKDIVDAWEADDFSEARFDRFETTMRRGCENWYEFIQLYYRLNVLFTYFVNKPKYRIDLLRLLAGDVWGEEKPEVLNRMRQVVEKVEQDENHIWHNMLGTLTADQFKPKF